MIEDFLLLEIVLQIGKNISIEAKLYNASDLITFYKFVSQYYRNKIWKQIFMKFINL